MLFRVASSYMFGLFVVIAVIGMPNVKGTNVGGTNVNFTSDVDDKFKSDQFFEVLLNHGRTIIKSITNVFGMSNPELECCWDGPIKRQNNEAWVNSKGEDCTCLTGDIVCKFNNVTVPTTGAT